MQQRAAAAEPQDDAEQCGPWFLYGPHWGEAAIAADAALGEGEIMLVAREPTVLKESTAYSWLLPEGAKRQLPAGFLLRCSSRNEVRSPLELSRHADSKHHWEVRLAPGVWQAVEEADSTWYIYMPHWYAAVPGSGGRQDDPSGAVAGRMLARQETFLKRSTAMSWELRAADKVPVSAQEVVCFHPPILEVADPRERVRHQHSLQHRAVVLESGEVRRLSTKAPRMPLCKYFPTDADILLRDIRQCFADVEFGPGAVLPAMVGRVPWGEVSLSSSRASPRFGPTPLGGDEDMAFLLPHGGYCNSGFVAAHGFRLLGMAPHRPLAIIIGNNHQPWHKVALSDQTWATPLGPVESDLAVVETLRQRGYPVDRQVHADEHSIENQLPFLRVASPGTRIVAIGVGAIDLHEAAELADHVAKLVRETGAWLLATTDFSHEGPSYGGPAMSMEEVTELTRRKDAPLLESVRAGDAASLLELSKGSSMCGPGSTAVFLLACSLLGLSQVEQLRYLVNTEVTPCGSTTGFASFCFRRPA